MNPVVIDSSVFVEAILYSRREPLEKIISGYDAFAPVNVLEETLFKTIIGIVGQNINLTFANSDNLPKYARDMSIIFSPFC